MINYSDRMADALVDVLRYSNADVEWPEPSDLKPNDGVSPEWFYPTIESELYSEISSILQYTQQAGLYDDTIGELTLGIALVEMKHYASVRDAIIALGGTLPQPYSNKNIILGNTPVEALALAAEGEIATIKFYKSIELKLSGNTDSVNITRQLLNKLIADERLHLTLINQKLKSMTDDKEKYETVVKNLLPEIEAFTL